MHSCVYCQPRALQISSCPHAPVHQPRISASYRLRACLSLPTGKARVDFAETAGAGAGLADCMSSLYSSGSTFNCGSTNTATTPKTAQPQYSGYAWFHRDKEVYKESIRSRHTQKRARAKRTQHQAIRRFQEVHHVEGGPLLQGNRLSIQKLLRRIVRAFHESSIRKIPQNTLPWPMA